MLTLLLAGGRSFLAVRGLALPRETELLCSFEFRFILALWVSFDRRTRDLIVPFEFDAFVFFAWPFVLPWYLYRTRGWSGLLYAAAAYGLSVLPDLTASIASIFSTA